jgi:tetratricopeptide (TPR) repeat protein
MKNNSCRHLLYVAFGAVLIGVSMQAAADSREYIDYADGAQKAIAEGRWAEADSLLQEALKAEPDNPANPLIVSNLGMIRFYAGDDSLAIATLDRAHEMMPQSVTVLANRARVLTAVGRFREAIDDYDEIERIDSTNITPYLYRGTMYLYAGDFGLAAKDMAKLEQLKPTDEPSVVALASYYSITNQTEKAIEYFTRLIEAVPAPEYYSGRAMCFLEKDRLYDAADDIAAGLALDDNYSELYLCRALLNKKRFCNDDALKDANRAIELGANRERVKALMGL